jgi:negative regulator of sigma E activity
MNQKLIQAYVDNRLTGAELSEFETALAQSPSLQKEVAAYQTLRDSIKSAGLQESTPNLQPMLANIARPAKTNWFAKSFPVAVAGIAIFGIGIAVNRVVKTQTNPTIVNAKVLPKEAMLQTKSRQIMQWDGNDAKEGAEHLRKTFYKAIPTIALNNTLPEAKFTGVSCGSCWINYEYTYNGQKYSIYGRCEKGNLDSGLQKLTGNQTFFVFSDAVGWYDAGDMTYVCTGGTNAGRFAVAQAASKRTSELR